MATLERRGWERFAPLTGIIAVALWIVGSFLLENSDRPDEDEEGADAFLQWVQDSDVELLVGGILFAFGALFFLWFLGSLRAALIAAEGGVGRVSTLAFASGVLVSFSIFLVPAPQVQSAINKDEISGESVRTMLNISDMFFGGVELFAIPMLVATALVILRTGVFARWVAWVSLALALLLAIVPIGWLGMIFGLPLWTILMSVLLYRPRPQAVAP